MEPTCFDPLARDALGCSLPSVPPAEPPSRESPCDAGEPKASGYPADPSLRALIPPCSALKGFTLRECAPGLWPRVWERSFQEEARARGLHRHDRGMIGA